MSTKVKIKVNVSEITKFGNGGGTRVVMMPVMANSEENKSFWENTPNGRIELHVDNPKAEFDFGEYYVEFSKAE